MSQELTVTDAIEFAIATEEMGARAYSKLAEKFSAEEEISAAFSLLAKDEQAHKTQFQALLDHVPPDEGVMTKDEKSRYLRAMAMSEFFRGDAGLIGKLDKANNLDEALIHVLGFEKATLGYYLVPVDKVGRTRRVRLVEWRLPANPGRTRRVRPTLCRQPGYYQQELSSSQRCSGRG